MSRYAAILILFALAGCQHAPTRVTETRERAHAVLVTKSQRPVEINDDTVVLDARGAFDFGLNHVRRAVNFTWDRLAESRGSGEFIRDARRAGVRLALSGVSPTTPIVVVGAARHGAGEDGRLAWSLVNLGFTDVQVTSHESLRALWTQDPPTPPKSIAPTDLRRVEGLELDAAGFKGLANSLADLKQKRIWLIDVRSAKEYLTGEPLAGSVNVEWTEFITEAGRPNPKIQAKLASVDIQRGDQIVLISTRGVRAGAAAFALMALDFPKVQIYRH